MTVKKSRMKRRNKSGREENGKANEERENITINKRKEKEGK